MSLETVPVQMQGVMLDIAAWRIVEKMIWDLNHRDFSSLENDALGLHHLAKQRGSAAGEPLPLGVGMTMLLDNLRPAVMAYIEEKQAGRIEKLLKYIEEQEAQAKKQNDATTNPD